MKRESNRGRFSNVRRCAGLIGLWVLSALVFSGHVNQVSAAGPERGGTLTVAVEADGRGFDPIKAGFLSSQARSVAMAIEERLFDMDAKGKLVPELGLSATPSKDGKTWTIKLRKGVSFHDGIPFNADAVVQHWERLLDPKNRFRGLVTMQPIESVKKVDDFTVRFQLKHVWVPFKDVIASTNGIAAYIPSPKAMKEGTQDLAPVGTGPYKFKEWIANDRLVVVRNPSYWRKGKPFLDSVVFRTVPDMQTRFAGLKSGELDVILTDRGASILQAREDRSLKVYSSDATGAETFIFNTSKPPLNDVRVRRALSYAWNQEFYIKASYKDTIAVARDPFGGTIACGDLGYRGFNPEKGRQLIAEYGKPVNLELQITNTPRGREFGEIVQRLYKEIGVTVTVTPLTLGQRNKKVFAGDYQMTGWQLFDATDMGPTLYANLYSKSEINFSQYRNPEMDKLLTTLQISANNKERQKALCGVAKQLNDEAVFLYRGAIRYSAIAKAGIQGISKVDHGIVRVSDVWIKKGGR
ncbi:ABC transporter substrate-binding protein [Geotalea uraniireducens]|uniref:4-phytase n=1 Tax=Geotalea uraniireducens (strain Rf4) TaxID=351605 RepID=A5GAK5_GEOUR|nr:ABC transporter substrate-binding protein [Geotalea uraniireducens]ABQ25393.1 4-phytase [Geotalea uraniireducens Rf4]